MLRAADLDATDHWAINILEIFTEVLVRSGNNGGAQNELFLHSSLK